jgi:D-3-phosphoglycerate dehydrogenase
MACGVANSPDYGVGEVATHALAMALALVRHLPFYDRDIRDGRWHYTSAGTLRRPAELTLGILGVGRIGSRMVHISRNVFRHVVACDPYVPDVRFPGGRAAGVPRGALPHGRRGLPARPAQRRDAPASPGRLALSSMKRGSWIVNTSRGAVADVDGILDALDSGQLDGAALDVLPQEPPPANHAILRHPRVLLTPHAAFYSAEGEKELRRKAAQNLVDWARTGRPTYVVVEGK